MVSKENFGDSQSLLTPLSMLDERVFTFSLENHLVPFLMCENIEWLRFM